MKKTKILDAAIVFVAAVIIILFINALLVAKLGIVGMAIVEILMVLVPVGIVLLRKENLTERFNLRLPSIRSFFAAVLLMLGAGMWENAASYIYISLFGMPEQNDMAFLEGYFANVDPFAALVIIALIPAICEELLFRGYLFDSFRGKKGKVAAVITTAVLFSVIHLDLYKMVPILIMALAFGYITAKTDSLLIPMIFHFINNAMSVISFYALRGQDVQAVTEAVSDQVYIWYAVAAFGIGLVFVYFGTRLFSGKPRKKWMNILVPILSAVVAVTGIIGAVANMMDIPYMQSFRNIIKEDTVFTETFMIEEDSYGVISAIVSGSGEHFVTVTSFDGEEIYNSADSVGTSLIPMKKGEYTVTYSFRYNENPNGINFYVNAEVMVITTTAITATDSEEITETV